MPLVACVLVISPGARALANVCGGRSDIRLHAWRPCGPRRSHPVLRREQLTPTPDSSSHISVSQTDAGIGGELSSTFFQALGPRKLTPDPALDGRIGGGGEFPATDLLSVTLGSVLSPVSVRQSVDLRHDLDVMPFILACWGGCSMQRRCGTVAIGQPYMSHRGS